MIYRLILKIRHRLYDKGVKKVHRAEVPSVCVGNISAGGTGKTPHVEMILRMLQESDSWGGRNIAVLSRGYKRESKGFQQVTVDGSALMFGDEPLQIKKNFPAVTVAVDKDRVEGCRFLCHPEELQSSRKGRKCWNRDFPASDLIVLDDAFQYRRLKADLNIVLVDYNRPLHKDRLLPFGSLRDLPERIESADVIIVTKCPYELDDWERTAWAETLGIMDYRTSTHTGTSRNGKVQTVLFSFVEYSDPKPLFDTSEPRYIYSKKVILFTGIAKDTPLRNYLSDRYKIVRSFSFPDHHRYTWSDMHKILTASKRFPTAAIVTTEKDAQRVLDYNGIPDSVRERMMMVPIRVRFLSVEESSIFASKLSGLNKH